jgi:hypothetical protein
LKNIWVEGTFRTIALRSVDENFVRRELSPKNVGKFVAVKSFHFNNSQPFNERLEAGSISSVTIRKFQKISMEFSSGPGGGGSNPLSPPFNPLSKPLLA